MIQTHILLKRENLLKENYLHFIERPEIQRFTEIGGIICLACNGRPLSDLLVLAEIGHITFGEKYVQEGIPKLNELQTHYPKIRKQYFGKLQTNKIKPIVSNFDHLESVAREKEIDYIVKYLPDPIQREKLSFFLEVNIGNEPQKNGASPKDAVRVLEYAKAKNLQIDGLMGIPPKNMDPKPYFKALRRLADKLGLNGCQMGFSRDYKDAIDLGSTHIRIGTLVFEG